ncbi:transposase-like protein, partial [Parabacteroides sp. PFB2-10]|nr:transposase-like protein [Parabacteroides sp. PFB2-10]
DQFQLANGGNFNWRRGSVSIGEQGSTRRGFSTNDDALKKSVYLAIAEIEKKWSQPIWNWGMIFNQFLTIFENRIQV